MKTKKLNKAIFGLGIIAGIRAMAALSMLSEHLVKHPSKKLARTPLNFLQTRKAADVFKLLAAGEVLSDKLPFMPPRIKPTPLMARGLAGLIIGATLISTKSKAIGKGATLGLAAAIASSYIFYFLRKKPSEAGTLPNAIWGTMEDGFILKQGQKLLS